MIAPSCQHKSFKKFGKDRHGNQRYRCLLCGCTWTERKPKPLGNMRIDKSQAVLCLRLLMEGNSIRSVERITHMNRETILNLLEIVGTRAIGFWETKMQSLPAMDVQCDEIWGFVRCKEKTKIRKRYGEECGDAYCWTAVERNSKLLVTWHLGKRSPHDANIFANKLREAVDGRFQLSTDGYTPYVSAIANAFQGQVDYAQVVKTYGNAPDAVAGRYSPAQITSVRLHSVSGHPNPALVSTSHVERHNLSIRMAIRRMTRLNNAHSKKWQNHEFAFAIWFLYYNFCRVHMTLKTTPAVAAGIASRTWTIEDMLDKLAE